MPKSKPAVTQTFVIDETIPWEILQYVKQQKKVYLLPEKHTEIMALAFFDRVDYLRLLIERRKKINFTYFNNKETNIPEFTESDTNGENVLFYAIRGDSKKCLAYLLSQGIDVHQTNMLGETPYVFALRLGKNNLANQLADFDTTVTHINLASIRTNYSLHKAFIYTLNMRDGWKETIDCFLSLKKEINDEGAFGLTPLQYMLLWWGQERKATRAYWGDYRNVLPDLMAYLAEQGASLISSSLSISNLLRSLDVEYDKTPTSFPYYLREIKPFNLPEKEIIAVQEFATDYACQLYLVKAKYYYLQVGDQISAMEYMRKAESVCELEFVGRTLDNITAPGKNLFKDDERRIVIEFINSEKQNLQQTKESKKVYKNLRTYGTFTSAASESLPLEGKLAERQEWLETISKSYCL